jgi:hypothetical protein
MSPLRGWGVSWIGFRGLAPPAKLFRRCATGDASDAVFGMAQWWREWIGVRGSEPRSGGMA